MPPRILMCTWAGPGPGDGWTLITMTMMWAPSVTEQGVLVAMGDRGTVDDGVAKTWVTGVRAWAVELSPWIFVPTQNATARSSSTPRTPPISRAGERRAGERLDAGERASGVVARVGFAKKSRSFEKRWEGAPG